MNNILWCCNDSVAMVTTPALLVSYYCGLLLREIDANLLINTMCSDGLLTPHEQAIISCGHSVHQRNLMLLEYTQHMDMQSLMSFCKLVQEMWPQVGSKLITGMYTIIISDLSILFKVYSYDLITYRITGNFQIDRFSKNKTGI